MPNVTVEAIVAGMLVNGHYDSDDRSFTCDIRELNLLPCSISKLDTFLIDDKMYHCYIIKDDYPSVIFYLYLA